MEDDDLRKTIEQAYDYHMALIDESDRGAAILASAQFEEWLRERLKSQFVELSKDLDKGIFDGYGPLSTFAAKVDIAYALGLFDEATRNGLHTIRRIRNKFAHASKPLYFSDEKVAVLCRKLSPEATSNPQELRMIYMNYLSQTQDSIRLALLPRNH